MNKYSNTITNTRGDSLPNYRAQVVDSTGAAVTIYEDSSSTRFTDGEGAIVNYATASAKGKVEFYWTAAAGQVLQILDVNGNLVDATADFANNFVLANLAGPIAQSEVTDLTTDLAAKVATADLASTASGKGAALFKYEDGTTGQGFFNRIDRVARLHPEDFASYGDPTDPAEAHLAFQAMIDYASTNSLPCLINQPYELKRILHMKRGVIIETSGEEPRLHNTLTSAEATTAGVDHSTQCFVMNLGGYHPKMLAKQTGSGSGTAGGTGVKVLDWHIGGAVQAGQSSIICTTAAEAGNYSKGDIVIVRDSLEYTQYISASGNTNVLPLTSQFNVVTEDGNTSTGEVKLRNPIPMSFAASLIAQADSATATDYYGNPLKAVADCRIEGLQIWSDLGGTFLYQGGTGLELYLQNPKGLYALPVNGLHNSVIEATGSMATAKLLELAMGSTCNKIRVIGGGFEHGGDTTPAIKVGENAHHNTVDFEGVSFKGKAASPNSYHTFINNGVGNTVRFKGGKVTGHFFSFVGVSVQAPTLADNPDQTNPLCTFDLDFFADTREAVVQRNVYMIAGTTQGAGTYINDSKESLREWTIRGDFRPDTAPTNAGSGGAAPLGYRGRLLAHIKEGNVLFPASGLEDFAFDLTGTPTLSGFASSGIPVTTSGRVNGQSQSNKPVAVATSSTAYGPDFSILNQTITFSGASFDLDTPTNFFNARRVRVTLVNGTAGAITPTVDTANFKLGVATIPSIGAGQQVTLDFERMKTTGNVWLLMNPALVAL